MALPGRDNDRLPRLIQGQWVAEATDSHFFYRSYSIHEQAAYLFADAAPRGSSLPSSGKADPLRSVLMQAARNSLARE